MLEHHDFVDAGFEALRNLSPARETAGLLKAAKRRQKQARTTRVVAGGIVLIAVGSVVGLALRPTPALAALAEAARLSSQQPLIHIRMDRTDHPAYPTSPAWPARPSTEIWRQQDRYLRKNGTVFAELLRNGEMRAYDNRFPFGLRSQYDARSDRFWSFDGSIGLALLQAHRSQPKVVEILKDGRKVLDYEWHDVDGRQNRSVSHVYVDARTKLVSGSDEQTVMLDGDTSHSRSVVEYPDLSKGGRSLPDFPKGLRFRTEADVRAEFDRFMRKPEQTKSIRGIKVSLYAAIISPFVPEGLGVEVLTTGGAGPDFGIDHLARISGAKTLTTGRVDWHPTEVSADQCKYGGECLVAGKNMIVNQARDLLARAPSAITVKTPVWRLGQRLVLRSGTLVPERRFVGYVSFTTRRVIYNVTDHAIVDRLR